MGQDSSGTVDDLAQLAAQHLGDPVLALLQLKTLRTVNPQLSAAWFWAEGLSEHELGHNEAAQTAFHRSIALAQQESDATLESKCRASLVVSFLQIGDKARAELELHRAIAAQTNASIGFVTFIRGLFAQRMGRASESLGLYKTAEALLVQINDRATLGVLYLNRGLLHVYADRNVEADRDLGCSEAIAIADSLTMLAGMAAHNLGFALGRDGQLADALNAFDRARERYGSVGSGTRNVPLLESDRAEVLLVAGLLQDARRSAELAVADLSAIGNVPDATEARLLLARICLADQDYVAARHHALQAARGFRRTSRTGWIALAMHIGLVADARRTLNTESPRILAARFERSAVRLDRHGWGVEALDAIVWASRCAIANGDLSGAAEHLHASARARQCASTVVRANAWLALALLHIGNGDSRRAFAALRSGLQAVDALRCKVGSTEASAETVRYGLELATAGIDLALASGDSRLVLWWAERMRAVVIKPRSVLPPRNPELESALDELRVASRSGESGHIESSRVRELALRNRPSLTTPTKRAAQAHGMTRLSNRLGRRVLVEYVRSGAMLWAVIADRRSSSLVRVGLVAPIEVAKDHLVSCLRRATMIGEADPRSRARIAECAHDLCELLLRPVLTSEPGTMVVSPTAPFHDVPWAALGAVVQREISVVPSATSWVDLDQRQPCAAQGSAFISGPHLLAAAAETALLAGLGSQTTLFSGPEATVAATLRAFESNRLVHLAAHGRFLPRSPMFSSLELADGQLTAYDLERLRQVPETVVLAACDMGSRSALVSDEALGFASILLAQGVACVIAPVIPVPDAATAQFMVDLHRVMAGGASPALAVAQASDLARFRPGIFDQIAASAFVCLGGSATDPGSDN